MLTEIILATSISAPIQCAIPQGEPTPLKCINQQYTREIKSLENLNENQRQIILNNPINSQYATTQNSSLVRTTLNLNLTNITTPTQTPAPISSNNIRIIGIRNETDTRDFFGETEYETDRKNIYQSNKQFGNRIPKHIRMQSWSRNNSYNKK